MTTSQYGLNLIQTFEGCRLSAYKDGNGIYTIGYGHTGPEVTKELVITQEQANDLLKRDVEATEEAVNRLVTVPLKQCEFDALVSFTYNVGQGRLAKSTLLKLLNDGQSTPVPQAFKLWSMVAGKHSDGLARRREAEIAMFTKRDTV